MTTLYGIPNCDTVKKARAWLTEHGVPDKALDVWLEAVGWEVLVNRKGTTWRKLEETERAAVCDAASAKALILAQASVIKRPVVEWGDGVVTVGFDAVGWAERQ